MKRKTVFDQGRTGLRPPSAPAGGDFVFGAFRKTAREKAAQPVKEVVTARLLGDPDPSRVVPEIIESPGSGCAPVPAPIYLTFREYRAALGETE